MISSFIHQYLQILILTFISLYQSFLCNRTLLGGVSSGQENILCGGEEQRRRKRRKIFGEGKYLVSRGEEKRRRKGRKIFGQQRRRNWEKIFGQEKYLVSEGEEKKRKIFFVEEKKNRERNGGKYLGDGKIVVGGRKEAGKLKALHVVLEDLKNEILWGKPADLSVLIVLCCFSSQTNLQVEREKLEST